MPQSTYTPLANITLGSSASSVTFSNIPNTYRDLILIVQARSNRASTIDFGNFAFNSTAIDSRVGMVGDTGGYSSYTSTNSALFECPAANATAGAYNAAIFNIMDYSATDKHKTILNRDNTNTTGNGVVAQASRWASTNAITSIAITSFYGASFVSGSTFALYGVIA